MPVTLGIARGRIQIDTADIAAARVVIERESRIMGRSFDDVGKRADTAARTASRGWSNVTRELRGLGRSMGLAVAGPGALAAGAQGGLFGVRLAGSLGAPGLSQFKGKTQDEAKNMIVNTIKQLVVVIVDQFLDFAKILSVGALAVKKGFDFVGDVVQLIGLSFQELIGTIVQGIGQMLVQIPGLTEAGQELVAGGVDAQRDAKMKRGDVQGRIDKVVKEGILPTTEEIKEIEKAAASVKKSILGALVEFLFPKEEEVKKAAGPTELDIFHDYKADIAAIEAEAQQDRLEATAKFEEKRAEVEADNQKRLGKFDADETKRRTRAAAALDRDIQGVRDEAKDREVEAAAEIEATKERARKDEVRAVADHQREMRDMEAEHRENLLSAASRLDARAVFEELKSHRLRKDKAEEGFKSQQDRNREAAAEHIKSIEDRLQADRDADERRIEDMREAFQIEEEERRADAAERRAELVQQGQDELTQLRKNHGDKIAQINQNAIDEKAARKTQWTNEVLELGGHGARMLAIQRGNHAAMEAEYMQFLAREAAARQQTAGINRPTGALAATNVYRMQSDLQPSRTLPPPVVRGTAFQEGTSRVPFTGMFNLHQGEVVARPDVSDIIRSVLGPSFTQPQLAAAVAGGGRGGLSIPVTVTALPGMSPHDIAQLVAAEVEPAVQRIMDGDR